MKVFCGFGSDFTDLEVFVFFFLAKEVFVFVGGFAIINFSLYFRGLNLKTFEKGSVFIFDQYEP